MTLDPRNILFYAGGAALERYGTLTRKVAPIARGGEEGVETFTRSGVASYIDRDGLLRKAATNTPRIEYVDLDGDGVRETALLLLEAARTNDCLYSEDWTNGAWAQNGLASITPNATTAPDGATSAEKLIENGASTTHRVRQSFSIAAGVPCAWSEYFKADTRTQCEVRLSDAGSTKIVGVRFDSATEALTDTTTGAGATLERSGFESLGDGWYRIWIVGVVGSETTIYGYGMLASGGTSTYTGDGTSGAFFWGGQFEENVKAPSSYVSTGAAGATRNVDAFSAPLYAPPQAGTLYLRFVERGGLYGYSAGALTVRLGTSSDPELYILPDGPANYKYRLTHNNGVSAVSSIAAAGPSIADLVELRGVFAPDGSVVLHQSINEAAEISASASAALALADAWALPKVYLGTTFAYSAAILTRGAPSLADFRALLP